jgi:hypothetical protein
MICHMRDGLNYIKEGSDGHNTINILRVFQVISQKREPAVAAGSFWIPSGFVSIL